MLRGSEKLNSACQGGCEPAADQGPGRDPLSGGKTSFPLALIIFAPIFLTALLLKWQLQQEDLRG